MWIPYIDYYVYTDLLAVVIDYGQATLEDKNDDNYLESLSLEMLSDKLNLYDEHFPSANVLVDYLHKKYSLKIIKNIGNIPDGPILEPKYVELFLNELKLEPIETIPSSLSWRNEQIYNAEIEEVLTEILLFNNFNYINDNVKNIILQNTKDPEIINLLNGNSKLLYYNFQKLDNYSNEQIIEFLYTLKDMYLNAIDRYFKKILYNLITDVNRIISRRKIIKLIPKELKNIIK